MLENSAIDRKPHQRTFVSDFATGSVMRHQGRCEDLAVCEMAENPYRSAKAKNRSRYKMLQ